MKQCYMCGHRHRIMASWMGQGETRYLCHTDSHSCYTDHNHMQYPIEGMFADLRKHLEDAG